MPKRPIAAEQHGALLTIDTACHGLGADVTGAVDCFEGGALSSLLHMNRFSIDRAPRPLSYAIVRQMERG